MFKLNCFGGKSIKKVNNWKKIELRKKDILFQYGFDIFALFFSFLCIYIYIYIFFFPPPVTLRPNASHDLFILEVSRSHSTTHHSR